jgi:hypothetical protein
MGNAMLDDERLYQQVIDELRLSGPREALWLKSLALSDGDPDKARLAYVKHRIAQLLAEEARRTALQPLVGRYEGLCTSSAGKVSGVLTLEVREFNQKVVGKAWFSRGLSGSGVLEGERNDAKLVGAFTDRKWGPCVLAANVSSDAGMVSGSYEMTKWNYHSHFNLKRQ